jgi:hypothetical protein
MDKRHFFLVIALGAGGAAWWYLGHPGWLSQEQKRQRFEQQKAAKEAAEPKLYKWRNARGELQLTDTPPPKGVKYQRVDMDALQNTVRGD